MFTENPYVLYFPLPKTHTKLKKPKTINTPKSPKTPKTPPPSPPCTNTTIPFKIPMIPKANEDEWEFV